MGEGIELSGIACMLKEKNQLFEKTIQTKITHIA